MDRGRGLARCRYCDTVVELDMLADPPRASSRPFSDRPPVPMPSRFAVDAQSGWLTVRWSWLTVKSAMAVLFAIAWDGFLVVWYAKALGASLAAETAAPGTLSSQADAWALAFPILQVVVGLLVTYWALASLLNTTTVRVSRGHVDVQHAPLPWLGSGPVDGILQLFAKERVHDRRHGSKSYSYELHVILRGGDKRRIVAGLEEAAQALWLEQAIEEHLRIEDSPVSGELPRR